MVLTHCPVKLWSTSLGVLLVTGQEQRGAVISQRWVPWSHSNQCCHFLSTRISLAFYPKKGLNAEFFPHAQGTMGMPKSMTRCRSLHLRTTNKELGSSWVPSPDCGGGGRNLAFPVLPPTAVSRVAWSRGGQRTPRRKGPPSPEVQGPEGKACPWAPVPVLRPGQGERLGFLPATIPPPGACNPFVFPLSL